MQTNQQINIQPSTMLAVIYAGLWLSTTMVILLLPVAFYYRALLIILLLGYGYVIFRRYICLSAANAIIAIEITVDNHYKLLTQQGEWQQASLLPDSLHTGLITLLLFKAKRRLPVSIIILPDSITAADYSRLSAALFSQSWI